MGIRSNNHPGKPWLFTDIDRKKKHCPPAEPADGRSSTASRQWPHKDFPSRDAMTYPSGSGYLEDHPSGCQWFTTMLNKSPK